MSAPKLKKEQAADSKHTPGPWHTHAGVEGGRFNVWSRIDHKALPRDFDQPVAKDINSSNARLIAAAPEMLELLKLAVRELEWADKNCQIKPMAGVSTFKSAAAQIKSTIAKATGGAK